MTSPKDLIGIVKELQRLERGEEKNWQHRPCSFDDAYWKEIVAMGKIPTQIACSVAEGHSEFICQLRNNFPAIASALLICVEALEKYENRNHWKDTATLFGVEWDFDGLRGPVVAEQALDKIHSLTLYDS